jgi:hypothetical protein
MMMSQVENVSRVQEEEKWPSTESKTILGMIRDRSANVLLPIITIMHVEFTQKMFAR